MTSPIINRLAQQGRFDLTLRTRVPRSLIRARLTSDIPIVEQASDFGMCMDSSLDVDREKSLQAYRRLHQNWQAAVEEEIRQLRVLQPDLILSNIPYLTLAAAQRLAVPALAYCSLNWADIVKYYFGELPDFRDEYIPQMYAAYDSARRFVCPAPAMDMPDLHNVTPVGPVASVGRQRKQEILERFRLAPRSRLVLISAGGVPTPIPVNQWPALQDVIWVCGWSFSSERKDILSIDDFPMPFSDWLASIDAVVTKPGYGMVSETVCHGKPALYVRRGDWAEEPFLIDWWRKHGNVLEIDRDTFFRGNFHPQLQTLWALPPRPAVEPSGISQTVEIINEFL